MGPGALAPARRTGSGRRAPNAHSSTSGRYCAGSKRGRNTSSAGSTVCSTSVALPAVPTDPWGRAYQYNAPGRNNGRPGRGDDDQAAGLVERVRSHEQAAPDEQAEHRERGEQVVAALGRLDPEYRAVLVMRDIEGFDYQQMADVLGLPLGTLKSRLFRARLALRDELKGYMK